MDYSSIELDLPAECIADCSYPGRDAEPYVKHWLQKPEIRSQFDSLTLLDTARILYGYGAWEVEELADREKNLERLLWLACGDDTQFLEGHGYTEELQVLLETPKQAAARYAAQVRKEHRGAYYEDDKS